MKFRMKEERRQRAEKWLAADVFPLWERFHGKFSLLAAYLEGCSFELSNMTRSEAIAREAESLERLPGPSPYTGHYCWGYSGDEQPQEHDCISSPEYPHGIWCLRCHQYVSQG